MALFICLTLRSRPRHDSRMFYVLITQFCSLFEQKCIHRWRLHKFNVLIVLNVPFRFHALFRPPAVTQRTSRTRENAPSTKRYETSTSTSTWGYGAWETHETVLMRRNLCSLSKPGYSGLIIRGSAALSLSLGRTSSSASIVRLGTCLACPFVAVWTHPLALLSGLLRVADDAMSHRTVTGLR